MKVLIDTGFLYGYCDARDQHHDRALELFEQIKYFNLYLAWPVTYETLRTRCVRNKLSVAIFEKFLRDTHIEYIDDSIYRQAVLNQTIKSAVRGRPISMVDMVLRFILDQSFYLLRLKKHQLFRELLLHKCRLFNEKMEGFHELRASYKKIIY